MNPAKAAYRVAVAVTGAAGQEKTEATAKTVKYAGWQGPQGRRKIPHPQSAGSTLVMYFCSGRTPTRFCLSALMPLSAAEAPVIVVIRQMLWA